MRRKLGRRAFLRGAAAGSALFTLPFLSALEARGEGFAFPKRLVVFFSPNGTIRESWAPSGGEQDFSLSKILSPLEAFRDKLIVVDGVDMVSSDHGPGDGHQKGMGHMLTATELLPGDFKGGGDNTSSGWAGGISVDQRIAQHLGVESLDLGVQVKGKNVWTRMSYDGPDMPRDPVEDPYAAFDQIFGNLTSDPADLERIRLQRQSVLDYVKDDIAKLSARLSSADRPKLEAHLSAVQSVEKKLDPKGQLGAFCTPAVLGEKLDPFASANFPAIGELMMDMTALALACDTTRVVGLQWSKSVGNTQFSWLNIAEGHHDLSHEGNDNADAIAKIVAINTWYAGRLAYLLQKLSEIPEGDGTLLDNTVVLWCNELGRGNSHTRKKVPWVLAGGAGGSLQTGRYLKVPDGTPHNKLHVSLCNAFGIQTDSFGNSAYGTGPLPGLTA
jgi:hypothetical protein